MPLSGFGFISRIFLLLLNAWNHQVKKSQSWNSNISIDICLQLQRQQTSYNQCMYFAWDNHGDRLTDVLLCMQFVETNHLTSSSVHTTLRQHTLSHNFTHFNGFDNSRGRRTKLSVGTKSRATVHCQNIRSVAYSVNACDACKWMVSYITVFWHCTLSRQCSTCLCLSFQV